MTGEGHVPTSKSWDGALICLVKIFGSVLFLQTVLFEESLSQLAHRKAPSFSPSAVGKVPGDTEPCPRLFYGKRPSLSATVLVEDGGNDLHGMGLVSFRALSHPLCDFLRRVAFGKGAGVRRYEHVRCSLVALMGSPSLLIDTVMRLSTPSWSLQLNGAHSRSALIFFPSMEPCCSIPQELRHVFSMVSYIASSLNILALLCMMCWFFLNFFMVYTPLYHSDIGGGLQNLTPLILSFSCSLPHS